jgi:hypothetical protein
LTTLCLDQDTQLDTLSQSIGRQHHLSLQINDELGEQAGLLDGLDEDLDRTGNSLSKARRRLDRVSKGARDNCRRSVFNLNPGYLIPFQALRSQLLWRFAYCCSLSSYSRHDRFYTSILGLSYVICDVNATLETMLCSHAYFFHAATYATGHPGIFVVCSTLCRTC